MDGTAHIVDATSSPPLPSPPCSDSAPPSSTRETIAPNPVTSQKKAFRDFTLFAPKLKGDEKSEAETFLFHLLAAFGHDPNTLPEGSTFEYRVPRPASR
jgi:hypothetical protein